ncbi:MAG: choice-of-anchor K domain-containing protein [bacterium]|nr:choice-of-anchor K domain-containing protein [bacterium]
MKKSGIYLVAISLVLVGFRPLEASTIQGKVSVSFTKPTPSNAVVSGVGTSLFKWGNAVPGGFPSYLSFTNNKLIEADINVPFSMGTLYYYNGEGAKQADSVQFNIGVELILPLAYIGNFKEKFTIITTPNRYSNPEYNADSVVFPSETPKSKIKLNGRTYVFEVLGFQVIGDYGIPKIINKLTVLEYRYQTAELIGVIRESRIVNVGDSIAAGYGHGPDGNNSSYGRQVALGWGKSKKYFGMNFAISGSISGNCKRHCEQNCAENWTPDCQNTCMHGDWSSTDNSCHSVIENQLLDAYESFPKIVTLTVGANDINFGECMEKWLNSDFLDNPLANPCWPDNPKLNERLALLKENLNIIFGFLYPADVFVTLYYNPFPRDTDKLCKEFYYPIAANAIFLQNGRIPLESDLKLMSSYFQTNTYSFANRVIQKLNGTIKDAAEFYPNVHVVPLDFNGHDLCQKSKSFVYGPSIDADITFLRTLVLTIKYEYKNALPGYCAFPHEIDSTPMIEKGNKDNDIYSFKYFVNCMPHPTLKGQTAIANAVTKAIKAQKLD